MAETPAPNLGEDEVRAIAALARLRVAESDLPGFVDHFAKMLRFVEHLAEADDPDLEPFRLDPRDVEQLRPDAPIPPGDPGAPATTEAWQRAAPETDGPYFSVPKVVGS